MQPVGVECFEGVVGADRDEVGAVEAAARAGGGPRARGDPARALRRPALLSAGGSVFFDVAAQLAAVPGCEVVLRSGCYLSHDDGMYEAASPLARSQGASDPLLPALELWTDVLSCPEPGRAIVGAGRRDAPYDAGLPTVLARLSRRRAARARARDRDRAQRPARVRDGGADGALRPGDLLCLGISHPCGAFDRWRTLLEVDADYTVTRAIRTFF